MSLEEELIDTTTEEGKKKLEELEKAEAAGQKAAGGPSQEMHPDPE